VKIYPNAYKDKVRIITENRSKSGVYRLTNRVNGKTYIGSSKNLGKRLKFYFNLAAILHTLKRSKSLIFSSLLKYGSAKFSVEILEYCEPSEVFKREQYYFDLVKLSIIS